MSAFRKNFARGIIDAIALDYRNGTKPAVLAERIIQLKLAPVVMAYVVLDVASYMTDHDELEFRSYFGWECTKEDK